MSRKIVQNITVNNAIRITYHSHTMNYTISIHEGIGELRFDMPVEQVVSLWGEPDSVENIDNACDETTTLLHYGDITLFFEGENPILSCIDCTESNCTLWDCNPFSMSESELVKLMVDHKFYEQDVDVEAWGERRITFNEGNIDFYFEEGALCSILLGK